MESTKLRARRKDAKTAVACEICGSDTKEPRRGLCIRCYRRMRRGSPALGGACQICGLTDLRLLRAVNVGDDALCLCHNCGWIAERYCSNPSSLEELRSRVFPGKDRRKGSNRRLAERRAGKGRRQGGDRRRQPRMLDKGDRRFNQDRRAG